MLKLYYWQDVINNKMKYYDSSALAIAETREEAIQEILETMESELEFKYRSETRENVEKDLNGHVPQIYKISKMAFYFPSTE